MTLGPSGRKSGKVRPFDNLKTEEIIAELNARKCVIKKTNKTELTKLLKKELEDHIRTPALCLNHELKSLEDLNLKNYEVSPIEILHDIKGHIHNIWEVLPEILSDPVKEKFEATLVGCYGSKGKVRGVDYR